MLARRFSKDDLKHLLFLLPQPRAKTADPSTALRYVGLETKTRALYMPGKLSTAKLWPQPLTLFSFTP